jgi:hypothetical protein
MTAASSDPPFEAEQPAVTTEQPRADVKRPWWITEREFERRRQRKNRRRPALTGGTSRGETRNRIRSLTRLMSLLTSLSLPTVRADARRARRLSASPGHHCGAGGVDA